MADQSTNFTASNGEYRNPFYQGTFEDETIEQMERRLHWAAAAVEAERVVLNNKTAPAPEAVQVEPVAWATRLYNTAYHAGHHDTVEGDYTHVYPQDMDSYHKDTVQEWLADNPQPAVHGEPIGWSGWGCQYPGKMPRLYGDRYIAELNCDTENGDQVLYFTAAPQPAEQQPEPISRNLRAVHAMILNVLDRDAADGRVVRGEMAAELRSAISEQSVIRHDWDDQDKCRRCGDRDWYASPTCTPKQQEKSHDN